MPGPAMGPNSCRQKKTEPVIAFCSWFWEPRVRADLWFQNEEPGKQDANLSTPVDGA